MPVATTVYLEPKLARAIRSKAAKTARSVSQLVNEALRTQLQQVESDLRYVRKHRQEQGRPLKQFIAEMKRNGDL